MPQLPELRLPATPVTIPVQRQVPAVVLQPGAAPPWHRHHATAVRSTDTLIVLLVVGISIAAGLGSDAAVDRARIFSGVVAGLLVLGALAAFHAWEPRLLGADSDEYQRLFRAFASAVIVLGLFSLATQIQSVRVWVFVHVPLTCLLCALGRRVLRARLHRERRAGRCLHRVLAVGDDAAVADLLARTRRDPGFGWEVVAACTPTGLDPDAGIPVIGDLDGIAAAAHAAGIDVVAVAPTPGFGPGRLQQLAWDLEDTGATLAVDPGITEIAGPRLHISPVDGMPLLRLTKPRFIGSARLAKDVLDRVAAAVLIIVLAPVLVVLAARCPIQKRIRLGRDGVPFAMRGFRAEPGGFVQRWSLDALPHLFNVFGGTMSLVGPRAMCPAEFHDEDDVRRRLLVKPGMTGVWHAHGWEESALLDLRYIENWSTTLDLAILWRTLGGMRRRATAAGGGAAAPE